MNSEARVLQNSNLMSVEVYANGRSVAHRLSEIRDSPMQCLNECTRKEIAGCAVQFGDNVNQPKDLFAVDTSNASIGRQE